MPAIAATILKLSSGFSLLIIASIILDRGRAPDYPIFQTVVVESTHPKQRALSLSKFKFCSNSGYVTGVFLAGALADWFEMGTSILIIACITALAGIIAHIKICCTLGKIYPLENCFQISHF